MTQTVTADSIISDFLNQYQRSYQGIPSHLVVVVGYANPYGFTFLSEWASKFERITIILGDNGEDSLRQTLENDPHSFLIKSREFISRSNVEVRYSGDLHAKYFLIISQGNIQIGLNGSANLTYRGLKESQEQMTTVVKQSEKDRMFSQYLDLKRDSNDFKSNLLSILGQEGWSQESQSFDRVQHTSRTRPIVRVLRFFYSCFKTLIVLPILFVFRNIFVIARNLYMILSKGYASWQPSRMKVWQKSVVVFLAEVIYWTAILAAISSVTTLILLNWVVLYEEISAVGNFFARAWNIILPIITILPILIILLAFGVAGLIITIIIVLVSDFVLGDIVSSLIGIGILLAAVVKLSVSGIE